MGFSAVPFTSFRFMILYLPDSKMVSPGFTVADTLGMYNSPLERGGMRCTRWLNKEQQVHTRARMRVIGFIVCITVQKGATDMHA